MNIYRLRRSFMLAFADTSYIQDTCLLGYFTNVEVYSYSNAPWSRTPKQYAPHKFFDPLALSPLSSRALSPSIFSSRYMSNRSGSQILLASPCRWCRRTEKYLQFVSHWFPYTVRISFGPTHRNIPSNQSYPLDCSDTSSPIWSSLQLGNEWMVHGSRRCRWRNESPPWVTKD